MKEGKKQDSLLQLLISKPPNEPHQAVQLPFPLLLLLPLLFLSPQPIPIPIALSALSTRSSSSGTKLWVRLNDAEEGPDLVIVVRANLRLDSLGAGHGGLLAEGRRGEAERGAGDVPEGPERGGADAVRAQQAVERAQVRLLLLPHVRDQRAQPRVVPEHKVLPRVD